MLRRIERILKHKRLIVATAVFALFFLDLFAQTIKPVNAQTTDSTTSSSAPIQVQLALGL